MRFPFTPIIFCIATSCAANAPEIMVSDAWARATAPGQSSAAVYAIIKNNGGPDRLVEVTSETGMPMIHRTEQDNNVARMRMLSDVAVPANEVVALLPGGTHVMLTGLTKPLAAGTSFPLTLRFAKAGPRSVTVIVVAAGAR